jgi:hypothetical protein
VCAIARFLPLPLLLLLPDKLTQSEEERPADEEKSLSGNPNVHLFVALTACAEALHLLQLR